MGKLKDLTGKTFGRLTVLRRVEDYVSETGIKTPVWECRCKCGNITNVRGSNLRSGNTKSCGCLRDEKIHTNSLTHGGSYDRLYHVWESMKGRCYNTNNQKYARYGGRGITVCDEWLHDYSEFKQWAISNGYDENADYGECTIDRINVNKGYCPDNCRFVDIKTQSTNKEKTILLELDGEVKSACEWADEFRIKKVTLRARVAKGKWDADKAIKTPVAELNKKYSYKGEEYTLRELSERFDINIQTLRGRVYKGWSIEDAVTRPVKSKNSPITINGESHTVKEWSELSGVNSSTIWNRIYTLGWDEERAVFTPAKHKQSKRISTSIA